MKDVKPFLTHELSQIQNNIARLKRSLEGISKDNPRGDGQRTMLAVQYDHYAVVSELISFADDCLDVEVICLMRLYEAIAQYESVARHDTNHGGMHCDDWWHNLNRVEYLTYLMQKINHLTLVRNDSKSQ